MANQNIHEGASETSPDMRDVKSDSELDTNGVPPVEGVVMPEATGTEEAKKVMIVEPAQDSVGDYSNLTTAEPEAQADARELDGDLEGEDAQVGMGKAKKKKSRSKPKSKRGLNAPTGFEEYYVDAPLTPAEHDEEKKIYDPSYTFAQRIEHAIQRFAAKRRLDSETRTLFDRYLVHGGVKGGPNMFAGLDPQTLKTSTAAEIAEMAATHYVDPDKVDSLNSTHVVDFERCLRSFLTGSLPAQWELTSEDKVKHLIGIIRNFLNYLLYHDVCPEYQDQIDATRALCDRAIPEVWKIATLAPLLPGDFNMACSEIFGGSYQGTYSADRAWMGDLETQYSVGISPERAPHVFKIGLAANASDEMFPKYKQQLDDKTCKITKVENTGLEVTEIVPANETVLNLYGQEQCKGLKPIGKLKAKTWFSPNAPEEDLTEEEEAHLKANPPALKDYEFWVEEEVLGKCVVGMKFEATVRETSFGLTFFDAFQSVHCSFYDVLPNELMADWREIEEQWLPMKKNRRPDQSGNEDQDEVADDIAQREGVDKVEPIPESNIDVQAEEADDVVVNTNIVAAGYDEDFEELAKKDTADQQTGVEVNKVGEELTQIAGNPNLVVQENFEVKEMAEKD